MDKKTLETIQNIIGYKFKNEQLLIQAFTRRSYALQNRGAAHCEVLEFYGDSVLGITVVKSMCQKFGKIKNNQFVSEKDEGDLTQIKSTWVDKKHLAHTVKVLGLDKYIKVGKEEENATGKKELSLKEDLCESIIGAVAVDCNWNFEILEKLCTGMLDVKEFTENTVRMLCDWCKNNGYEFPKFSKVKPNENFKQEILKKENLTDIKNLFFQKVEIPELNISFIGYDETETEAKMQASFKALNYFNKFEMKKEIENPNLENATNQLNNLFSKNYIEKPKFEFTKKDSKWECVCLVENHKSTISVDKSKNLASKKSALKMINQLTDLSIIE